MLASSLGSIDRINKLSAPCDKLAPRGTAHPCKRRLSSDQVERLNQYIQTHLGACITVDHLAGVVHLSRFHFCRVFRATIGISPRMYLLKARLETAKSMMGAPAVRLCEIAYACGFADQSHLTRRFKEQLGVTPSFWRASNAGSN